MRTSDINAFTGELKNAVHDWLIHKVDEMFPNKPKVRVIAKNAINNGMNRIDDKINGYVDSLFLFFGDESGTIDSDTLVDGVVSLLEEIKPTDFDLWALRTTVGNGEIVLRFPHNAFVGMITDGLEGYRFTSSDIKDLKNYFNQ